MASNFFCFKKMEDWEKKQRGKEEERKRGNEEGMRQEEKQKLQQNLRIYFLTYTMKIMM